MLKRQIGGKFGLDGEFDKGFRIARIDKETLINNVAEFKKFGIKLDDDFNNNL